MAKPTYRRLATGVLFGLALLLSGASSGQEDAGLAIEYPLDGSIFPPEITAPVFLWRDASLTVRAWKIDIEFAGDHALRSITSAGEPPKLGDLDPRAVSETNRPPSLQAGTHSWTPDEATWSEIKRRSVDGSAKVTIRREGVHTVAGSAAVTLRTSRDPAGAPIFYRDVPLMPSEAQKGVIKPLDSAAIPLIAWRLRNLSEPRSRLLLEGVHSCANCHSFSRDGKTLGMDVDGPENDKGTYAMVTLAPQTTIRTSDVMTWNSFGGTTGGVRTIGFLSQVSPDGRHAVSTVNEEVYVANFRDYRFLQVFYPTRGILAWYSRADGKIRALPGADDPRFVHTDAVWSPDGSYLIFARAAARAAYPGGSRPAAFVNDPGELQIQYDLYRIPFNGGRGGKAEPVAGASQNGMSNTFPKISPDGRWIVFVKCRNGQLMRPDSELYIVPSAGGTARRMRCNTRLMNSWHSFSPNGRWMVFSSKSRSPYTQMFLTHIDENGQDSPPVLVENATAANRAVNLPEFVNIRPDGLLRMEMPASEFYSLFDTAMDLQRQGKSQAAVSAWKQALAMDPANAKARTNYGIALWSLGARADALAELRRAVEVNPRFMQARNNLAVALVQTGAFEEAIAQLRAVLAANPESAEANQNLGVALMESGRVEEATAHYEKLLAIHPEDPALHYALGNALHFGGNDAGALRHWLRAVELQPGNVSALNQAAWLMATSEDAALRNGQESVRLARRVLQLTGEREPGVFDTLAAAYAESGRFAEALDAARRGVAAAGDKDGQLLKDMRARAAGYEKHQPFRQGRQPPVSKPGEGR